MKTILNCIQVSHHLNQGGPSNWFLFPAPANVIGNSKVEQGSRAKKLADKWILCSLLLSPHHSDMQSANASDFRTLIPILWCDPEITAFTFTILGLSQPGPCKLTLSRSLSQLVRRLSYATYFPTYLEAFAAPDAWYRSFEYEDT